MFLGKALIIELTKGMRGGFGDGGIVEKGCEGITVF
jgi:hypothetical protein